MFIYIFVRSQAPLSQLSPSYWTRLLIVNCSSPGFVIALYQLIKSDICSSFDKGETSWDKKEFAFASQLVIALSTLYILDIIYVLDCHSFGKALRTTLLMSQLVPA